MRHGLAAATAPLVAMSLAAAVAVSGTDQAASAASLAVEQQPWAHFLGEDFYHTTLVPLLVATVALAWCARPSTTEEIPRGFHRFQLTYLPVWGACVAADWLQGPYVYALYAAYGFSTQQIAQLFVAGFGSSMVFGCFVGTFTDRFGRKKCCMAYCVLYTASCLTKHFKSYYVLMLGRLTGGIATSMLYSCFECWMVSEHTQNHKFSRGLLSYMFGAKFTLMYCIAIVSGLVAQLVADAVPFGPIADGSVIYVGGCCGPFDVAIVCLVAGFCLVGSIWTENYGDNGAGEGTDAGLWRNVQVAGQLLLAEPRMMLLGVVVACFEGAMFAFVFNWTPALDSKETPPPHGMIFSLFMMACMCGASATTVVGSAQWPTVALSGIFSMGISAFVLAGSMAGLNRVGVVFAAFLTFEFCVGAYFPMVGVLKSDLVPERVRGTVYNIYRVPLNAVVVCLLLSDISMVTCFNLCASLLTLALVTVLLIHNGRLCGYGCSKALEEADPKHV